MRGALPEPFAMAGDLMRGGASGKTYDSRLGLDFGIIGHSFHACGGDCMTLTIEQIREAALRLDRTEREALAEELWQSISEADREANDAAWLAEIERRSAAFDRGETTESDVDTVIARIKSRRRP